jgi:hypothetical protein
MCSSVSAEVETGDNNNDNNMNTKLKPGQKVSAHIKGRLVRGEVVSVSRGSACTTMGYFTRRRPGVWVAEGKGTFCAVLGEYTLHF